MLNKKVQNTLCCPTSCDIALNDKSMRPVRPKRTIHVMGCADKLSLSSRSDHFLKLENIFKKIFRNLFKFNSQTNIENKFSKSDSKSIPKHKLSFKIIGAERETNQHEQKCPKC